MASRSLMIKLIFPPTLWHWSGGLTTFEGQVTNLSWFSWRVLANVNSRKFEKRGKNLCKTKIFFQSVRVLGLFLNLPLFTFARTLHENQAGFVTWPSKVARPLDRCQRVEGKISLILSDLEVTVLNQIPQQFNFCKFSYYTLYCNSSNKAATSCIFLHQVLKPTRV